MFLLILFTALSVALGGSMPTPQPGHADSTANFPALVSKDLSGRSVALPKELPGERTILLVAFRREQQTAIDGWASGLRLDTGNLPWLELPVINDPGAIGRWFIDNGMRRGIHDHETWKHVVTLYIKKEAFKAAVGIKDESVVYAMVVDRQGKILATVPGPFSPQGAALLSAHLRTHPQNRSSEALAKVTQACESPQFS